MEKVINVMPGKSNKYYPEWWFNGDVTSDVIYHDTK